MVEEEKKSMGSKLLQGMVQKRIFKQHAEDGSLDELFAKCL
jgi:hypothetical protein